MHPINGSYYFSSFYVFFPLPILDLFTLIYDDHNSGKEKLNCMDQMHIYEYTKAEHLRLGSPKTHER